jgi:hypothetical protein
MDDKSTGRNGILPGITSLWTLIQVGKIKMREQSFELVEW